MSATRPPILPVEARPDIRLVACSICLRVHRDAGWTAPETAIRELRSYERANAPRLEPAVCDECAGAVAARRRAARDLPLAA